MAKYRISEYHYAFLRQSGSRMDQVVLRERAVNRGLLSESIMFTVDGYDYGDDTYSAEAPYMDMANYNAAYLIGALGLPFKDSSGKFSVQMLLGQIAVTRSKLEGMDMPDQSYRKQVGLPNAPQFGVGGSAISDLGTRSDIHNVKKQSFPAPSLNEVRFDNVMGKDQLLRYLDRLEDMCRWALDNGYTEISFG